MLMHFNHETVYYYRLRSTMIIYRMHHIDEDYIYYIERAKRVSKKFLCTNVILNRESTKFVNSNQILTQFLLNLIV